MSDHLTVPASAQNSKSPQKAPKARVSVKFIIVGGSITGEISTTNCGIRFEEAEDDR